MSFHTLSKTFTLTLVGFAILSWPMWVMYLEQQAERERGTAAVEGASATVALPLRCSNGAEPRVWTRQEAEGRMHSAQMSLRSAEHHGVWTDLGRRWSQLAEAQMAEIRLCWGGTR